MTNAMVASASDSWVQGPSHEADQSVDAGLVLPVARNDLAQASDSVAWPAGAADSAVVDAVRLPGPAHTPERPAGPGSDIAVPFLSYRPATVETLPGTATSPAVPSLSFPGVEPGPAVPHAARIVPAKQADRSAPRFSRPLHFPLTSPGLRNPVYRQTARDQMLSPWQGTYGFLGDGGYIVDRFTADGSEKTIGEGTLHTAIAAVAIAAGNYTQDPWEKGHADQVLEGLLETLTERSWGNADDLGRKHPIRHPHDYDYAADGTRFRNSPLTKDSFGAIIAACYYAGTCEHSSIGVKTKARALVEKWIEYLVLNQWRLHSTYIPGEFEAEGGHYKNIFSGPNREPKDYKGPEGFTLLPHEIYALKSAGTALEVVTDQIEPWTTSLPAALTQSIVDVAAPYLARLAGEALAFVLSSLTIRKPYEVNLGGVDDWLFGLLTGELVIDVLPEAAQRSIVEEFQNVLVDAIREGFRLVFLGGSPPVDLIGAAVNRIVDRMPDSLDRDSWLGLLTAAMKELAGWLDGTAWIEAGSFVGGLQMTQEIDKPDVTSYTVWSFATGCEPDQVMTTLLRPFAVHFWEYLRGTGNPNGLWAWFVGDAGTVEEELALFEALRHDRWPNFAFGEKKFTDWSAQPEDPSPAFKSPRLDYLVLDGLAEKESPQPTPGPAGDWWNVFVSAALRAIDRIKKEILDQYQADGRYGRDLYDTAGRRVIELWEAGGKYTRDILDGAGQRIERLVSQQGGELSRWFWTADGVFSHHFRWQRLLPDGTTSPADVVEWLRRNPLGEMERTTWYADHALESYRKWWKSSAAGGASPQDLVHRTRRTADGELTTEIWTNDHVFESLRQWWRSAATGAAEAADATIIKLRDAAGVMNKWTLTVAGVFDTHGTWCRSAIDGSAAAIDMVYSRVRDAAGALEMTTWSTAHVFERYQKWWRSEIDGSAQTLDVVEVSVRDAAGQLARKFWNENQVYLSYQRWWRSAVDGSAVDVDLALTQIRDADGVLRQWAHRVDGSFESYGVWCRSAIDGVATTADLVESRIRDAAGALMISTWSTSHVFETYRRWWKSAVDGSAGEQELVESRQRATDGVLKIWTWTDDHVFLTFRKWHTSAGDGSAEAVDQAITQVRNAAGDLEEWLYAVGRVLEQYAHWWRSAPNGVPDPADTIELRTRDAAGELKRWIWNTSGVFTNYWRWWRSTSDGGTIDPTDLRYRASVEVENGQVVRKIIESWDGAGHSARSVFDANGNLLEGLRIPFPHWPPF
jgi:hypothetical protein